MRPPWHAPPRQPDVYAGTWRGGRLDAAAYLLGCGATSTTSPVWEELTPLDAAARSAATEVLTWLHAHGAKIAAQLRGD